MTKSGTLEGTEACVKRRFVGVFSAIRPYSDIFSPHFLEQKSPEGEKKLTQDRRIRWQRDGVGRFEVWDMPEGLKKDIHENAT